MIKIYGQNGLSTLTTITHDDTGFKKVTPPSVHFCIHVCVYVVFAFP